jgi:hypothetical protein
MQPRSGIGSPASRTPWVQAAIASSTLAGASARVSPHDKPPAS